MHRESLARARLSNAKVSPHHLINIDPDLAIGKNAHFVALQNIFGDTLASNGLKHISLGGSGAQD
jgi:hypothetical protein